MTFTHRNRTGNFSLQEVFHRSKVPNRFEEDSGGSRSMASTSRAVLKTADRVHERIQGAISVQTELASTVVAANSSFLRIEMWDSDDLSRDTFLMAIELTDLDFGPGRRVGHIHATQRDDFSEDR